VALPFTLKSILRQKKNYGNSNISPSKIYNLPKIPPKETKIFQDIITLKIISSFNTSQNIIFQKSSYKIDLLLPRGPKSLNLLYSIMNLNTTSALDTKQRNL
jgi:hypothetical protein